MNETNAFHEVLWPDSEFETLTVDYDALKVVVREGTGRLVEVCCNGYIGYNCTGFWDEIVIEKADVMASHPFIDTCVENICSHLGTNFPSSGCIARNAGAYSVLILRFIDGAELFVAFGSLTVKPIE